MCTQRMGRVSTTNPAEQHMHLIGSDQEDCRAAKSPAEGEDCEFVMEWISTLFDFLQQYVADTWPQMGAEGRKDL